MATNNYYLKLKEDISHEKYFRENTEVETEFLKPLESVDYLTRCQNNLKHAICISAFINPNK